MLSSDILKYDITELLAWINEEVEKNPKGRMNEYTKVHREIGAQYTVPEMNCTKLLFDKIRKYGNTSDVWVNYNPPGARNNQHHHIGGDISGCWYLIVPEESGQLYFETGERIYPKPFDFIVWDSRKVHGVTTNLSNSNRISIAFNVWKTNE